MTQFYIDPTLADDKWSLPDGEAFYAKEGEWTDNEGEPNEAGFYWWVCFPGRMPEGDGVPNGPFETEDAAIADARETFAE